MREDHVVEGALQAKHHDGSKRNKFLKNQPSTSENFQNNQDMEKGRKNYPPCQHCGK